MARCWSFGFAEKNSDNDGAVRQVKYLLGGKRVQYVCIDTRADSGRVAESLPHGGLKPLLWGIWGDFLWTVIMIRLVHSPYLVYFRVLPSVHTSLSQDGFYRKGIWVEHPLAYFPFGVQGVFSVHAWSGRSPDCKNEKYMVWAGPSRLALIALLFTSTTERRN